MQDRMTPLEWMQITGSNYQGLADTCGYTYEGVKQWFKRGSGKRNPHESVHRLLAMDVQLRELKRNASQV
jgi:hypothetical protein